MAEFEYDVAISFAGPQRSLARRICELLVARHVKVFYDEFEQARLWGKELAVYLDDVFQHKPRFCIVITSKAYLERDWTRHELSAALSRAISQRTDYILPLRTDDTDIPGIPRTRAYIDARILSVEEIANLVVRKLLEDTQGASDLVRSSIADQRLRLTPEEPEDAPETQSLWQQHCESPEQTTFHDTECAWVMPFPTCGVAVDDIELVYDKESHFQPRYDTLLHDGARAALEAWASTNPIQYQRLSSEPWELQVRFAGLEFVHEGYKFRLHLSPVKYLYYVAIQARVWSRELASLRRAVFENALTLDLARQKSPLMLPSQFAVHMAVASSDNFLLLRQRTPYTELYPNAWEAGVGEFMHGEECGRFPHFINGRPDLGLFLKNAVYEELGFDGARDDDFRLYGFGVEYRTLAPKLLVVYRSHADIASLITSAQAAKDRARTVNKIKLAPEDIAQAVSAQAYPTWGPTSKLAMVLALLEDRNESIRHELLKQMREWFNLIRARSSPIASGAS